MITRRTDEIREQSRNCALTHRASDSAEIEFDSPSFFLRNGRVEIQAGGMNDVFRR